MRDLLIHDYNIYNDIDERIGDGEEISLPDLSPNTTDVSGSGITGNIKVPVPGMYDSLVVDIPFRMLSSKASDLFIGNRYTTAKIRGGILVMDESTGEMTDKSIVVTVKGMGTKLSLGKLKQGSTMNSGVSIEAIYYSVTINDEPIFELDKLNAVCKINGVDILEGLRNMC